MTISHPTNTISLYEYEAIGLEPCIPDGPTLSRKNFERLKIFCVEERKGHPALLQLAVRNGQEVIVAKNYVGVIAFPDGITLEILPKITGDDNTTPQDIKDLFYAMVTTLPDIPFRMSTRAMLATHKMNLWEIFLSLFLRCVGKLITSGLISQYITKEENLSYYRGKILFTRHIKHNLIHQERIYVAHDVFHINCPENQVIKSALLLVKKLSHSLQNQMNARRYIDAFARVDRIMRIHQALSHCKRIMISRENHAYQRSLAWAKLILEQLCISQFTGKEKAVALLFPTERLFESFVAKTLQEYLQQKNKESKTSWQLRLQEQTHTLFDSPEPVIRLRPDIILYKKQETSPDHNKKTSPYVICDTKWKRIDRHPTAGDFYQMVAYQSAYECNTMVLLFPMIAKQNGLIRNKSAIYSQKKAPSIQYGYYRLNLFALQKDRQKKTPSTPGPSRWDNFFTWLDNNTNNSLHALDSSC